MVPDVADTYRRNHDGSGAWVGAGRITAGQWARIEVLGISGAVGWSMYRQNWHAELLAPPDPQTTPTLWQPTAPVFAVGQYARQISYDTTGSSTTSYWRCVAAAGPMADGVLPSQLVKRWSETALTAGDIVERTDYFGNPVTYWRANVSIATLSIEGDPRTNGKFTSVAGGPPAAVYYPGYFVQQFATPAVVLASSVAAWVEPAGWDLDRVYTDQDRRNGQRCPPVFGHLDAATIPVRRFGRAVEKLEVLIDGSVMATRQRVRVCDPETGAITETVTGAGQSVALPEVPEQPANLFAVEGLGTVIPVDDFDRRAYNSAAWPNAAWTVTRHSIDSAIPVAGDACAPFGNGSEDDGATTATADALMSASWAADQVVLEYECSAPWFRYRNHSVRNGEGACEWVEDPATGFFDHYLYFRVRYTFTVSEEITWDSFSASLAASAAAAAWTTRNADGTPVTLTLGNVTGGLSGAEVTVSQCDLRITGAPRGKVAYEDFSVALCGGGAQCVTLVSGSVLAGKPWVRSATISPGLACPP